MKPFIYIDEWREWEALIDLLNQETQFAVDLESNGMFAYRESICLIQISTRTQDYIIDPHANLDLQPLGDLIENQAIEKVFHASEYDLILMKRLQGWHLKNMFDTMWAVRILGHEKIGLANVLAHYYGIKLSKKYQRANWCERPLSAAQLAYAQNDTHHLLTLRDDLAKALEKQGRLEEAFEIFSEQADVRLPDIDFDPDGFWSIKGMTRMMPREQAVARALYIYRDREAKRQDKPHFKVFGDQTLLSIIEWMPRNNAELYDVHRLSDWQIQKYGRGILRCVQDGLRSKSPQKPRPRNRPDDHIMSRYDILQNWRKDRANQRGVASDVVLSRTAMWELAKKHPQSMADFEAIDTLGPWRRNMYGEEIIALLR